MNGIKMEKFKDFGKAAVYSAAFCVAVLAIASLTATDVFAQTIPVDRDSSRIGTIVGWVFRIAYIFLNILGITNVFQGIKMWSDGQPGTSKKIITGIAFLVPGLLVGIATELAAGNLPDIGMSDVFGG